MFWHKIVVVFFLILSISCASGETNSSIKKPKFDLEKFIYKNALKDYSLGSYYEALDEFLQIVKNPKSPYYAKSLLMLSKVYLQIAKRTGIKKYLWTSLYYLNFYIPKAKKLDWDYYYTRGNIFETLGFYEKALADYKISLQKAPKNKEIDSIIAILRVAAWLKKLDLVTKYEILVNMAQLEKNQKKELEFIKGMQLFMEEKYNEAFKYMLKTYREFESYLIDNPSYYYMVAESAYRKGDIQFAKQLFRRILNLIKNREVLKKSLLRMGDILLKQADINNALNYYYQLISTYPKSKEATVAKLKLISLIYRDEKLKKTLKKFFPNQKFLEDPSGFVVTTLVKNRTNYIGRYALGNFGVIVFKLNSEKLYKRLEWELSLLSSNRMDYEQKEYINDLWSSYLLVLDSKKLCELYLSNENFFKKIFSQNVLIKISDSLKKCKKTTERLKLLKFILNKWRTDNNRFLFAKALFESGDYKNSVKVLETIKNKDCKYYKLYAKNCIMMNNKGDNCIKIMEKSLNMCGLNDFEAVILSKYADLLKDRDIEFQFINRFSKKIAKDFKKDIIIRKFIEKYSQKLLEESKYEKLIKILEPISQNLKNSCYINSILAISYVRIGKMKYANSLIENLSKCNDSWSKTAKIIYESQKLLRKAENE